MAAVLADDDRGRGVIEHYLFDLRMQLAFYGVRRRRAERAVAEARDHLTELAAEHGPEEAVDRFGPAHSLAIEIARTEQPVALFRCALVLLGAVALFVLPLYGIPENTLPPAPWVERPDYLTWKLNVAVGAFGIALAAATLAVAAAWLRWRRVTLVVLAFAGVSLAVSAGIGTIGAVQWAQAVPGSGTTLVLTLASTIGLAGVAAAALIRAFSRPYPSRAASASD
jgi:hypothetical protein